MTGMFKAGILALTELTKYILANSHIAQTADCDELYGATEPGALVFCRAFSPVQIPRRAIAAPKQHAKTLIIIVCRYFALGKIGREMTVMIGTRYPMVP